MPSAVELVPQLVSFTRDWEQFTPNAYPDGTQTSIGYGTKAQPGETTITREEAERRLNDELTKAAQYVDSVPGAGQLPDSVKMGLTDQAYNAGGFGTGLKSAIAAGDVSAVTGQMDKYRGTSVPGTEQGVSNRVDARLQLANGTYQGRPGNDVPPPQVAAAVTPPLPNLRPNPQLAYAQPSSGLPANDYGAAAQLASYNTTTPQQPQRSFVDDLGGNGTSSPLHQFKVYEPSDVSAGPYGADALVKAAMSVDVAAFNKAMGDLTGAAAKDALTPAFLGGIGMDGVQKKLQGYFDQLQQQSPGAVRAMQTAYSSNPQLAAAVPPQLQSALQDAFKALPAQSTGQVPLPNMRPSTVPQASAPPPLPTQPSGPTMVSDTTSLPPKDDPRFPPGWSPGQPLPNDAGDAGSWPDNPATNFTQPKYWTPSTLNPSQLNAMDGGGGSTVANPPQWQPTVATPPPMPSFNYQPYINSGQIQFSNYGQGGPQTPFFGVPQSQFQSTFNAMVPPPLPLGMPNFGTPAAMRPPTEQAAPRQIVSQPQPQPPPMPQLSQLDLNVAAAQARGAPVNIAATYANDPYAQPGTENTPVLNDLGYGGGELGGPGFNAFVYG